MPTSARRPGSSRPRALRSHLLAVTAATLLPTAVFGGMLLRRIAYEERAALERRLAQDAEMLGAALDREMAATLRALETLARSDHLDEHPATFRDEAVRAIAINPSWMAIVLFTPDGERAVDTREAAPSGPARQPESLERALRTKRPAIGDLVLGADGAAEGFPVRVPVLRDGQVRWVLSAILSAAAVGEAISMGGPSELEWTRTVVDRAGRVVAQTRSPELAGQRATEPFLTRTAASAEGVFRARALEGFDACVAFTHASLSGWTAAIVAPAAIVDAPVRRSLLTLLAASLGIFAVSVIAAFGASRRFSAAIASVSRAADALAHGGRAEVEPHGIVEIAQVGSALRRSAHLLEARRRDAEEHLARAAAARAEAESSNRAKDEFLAMLGHELRNPLSPIVTALHLLRQRGQRWGREHEIIARQVGHLVRLVDDLLDVSRVTRGMIDLHLERVDVAVAVSRALEMASPLFEERQHRLTVDVAPGLDVVADTARFAQVIANLLTNAARYTPPRGSVTLVARREPDGVAVTVTDDGQGIDPALLPHLFDLFVQGPRSRDRAEGGLGIGLALVRTLVRLHGGRVEARSDGPGRGSSFRVVLPPAAASAEATAPSPSAVSSRGGGGDARRILVADDNADAAALLTEFLAQAGHEVVTAHDGPGAVDAVDAFAPDVAILDIGLPGMDGYEVAARIRAKLGARTPAFVALTGYGQSSDRARSREAGFAHHFVKPADPAEVLQAVEHLGGGAGAGGPR